MFSKLYVCFLVSFSTKKKVSDVSGFCYFYFLFFVIIFPSPNKLHKVLKNNSAFNCFLKNKLFGPTNPNSI